MKKFTALLSLVLAVALTASLAACGGDDGGGNSGNGGSTLIDGVTFNQRSGEMFLESKENKLPIKFSYTPGYGDEWIRRISASFLKSEQGKNYYMVLDNDSELTSALQSRFQSGNVSDIYFPLASNWQSYAQQGYLEPLDDLYNSKAPGDDETILDKITGNWKTYGRFTYTGVEHFFIFPGNENVAGIVYNKTMFDEHGWTVPETVDELKALCDRIVADGAVPFTYPGNVEGGYWDFIGTNWWLQYSGIDGLNEFMGFDSAEVFNPDKGPSDGKYSMLKTYEDLIVKNKTKYILRGSASATHSIAQMNFGAGAAAMIPNGNWIMNESLGESDYEFRMMAVPTVKNALKDTDGNVIKYNYAGQPDYMLIPSAAKNKEGAKEFLRYMCSDEILEMYAELCGTLRPFNFDVSAVKAKVNGFTKSVFDIWENSTTWYEMSAGTLWTSGKIHKYQTTNPYTTLLADNTITASSWCQTEYDRVKAAWSDFTK